MTTRGAIAIAGEKFKMIVAETMIRKMWRDILLHAMMTEIEAINNTEKNKKNRKPYNPKDTWVRHQKVSRNHPNTIAIAPDTIRANLLTTKEVRIRAAIFRTKLRRKRLSNPSISIILRRSRITRNRKVRIIIKKQRLRRVASMEIIKCREIMKKGFIPNLNLEPWDPLFLPHLPIRVNFKRIRQKNSNFSPEKTNTNDSRSSSSQNSRKERKKERRDSSQNAKSSKNQSSNLRSQNLHLLEDSTK